MKRTECARRREGGFTLIEVLIAMVLLAVGLLALQGLGVMAIQTLGFADRGSRGAAMASEYLEDGLRSLRNDLVPRSFSCTVNGDVLTREVDTTNPNLPRVTVTVTPEPRGGTPRPYTVSASVFRSAPLSGTPSTAATPCGP